MLIISGAAVQQIPNQILGQIMEKNCKMSKSLRFQKLIKILVKKRLIILIQK